MDGMRSLPAILILLFSVAGFAQDAADAAQRSIATMQALLRERPEDPTLWFYLARSQARAHDAKACVAALERAEALGEGFLPGRELGFANVWDDRAFQAARARMEAKLPRLDFAPTAFELEDRGLLPEGIAYDAPSHDFFLGSLAEHRIVRVNAERAVGEFAGASAGLDAILGLAVDAPRRTLYAVSTSALTEAGAKSPRNAIFAFDVDSGRLLRRVDLPQAAQLNDVAVAPGGAAVYTSDSGNGAVFEVPARGAPRTVVPAGALRGSNGLAVSADGRRLYVAHAFGLAVVDLVSGEMKRVAIPPRETVAAIDGLYTWQDGLVGVQNTTTPGRVIVMTLAHDGESVTRVQTLLSHHHPVLNEPTTGAVTADGFFLLAATGVTHLGRDGRVEHPESVPKPAVLRVPLPR
jgi:sugar lactone lactonase YvrE